MKQSIKNKLAELANLASLQQRLAAAVDKIDAVKARRQAEVLEYLGKNREDYNVKIEKNLAIGVVDDYIFKVATSNQVGRLSGKPETEKKWLESLPIGFCRLKRSLDKQAIKRASDPELPASFTARELKSWDLGVVPVQSIKVVKNLDMKELAELQKLATEAIEKYFEIEE